MISICFSVFLIVSLIYIILQIVNHNPIHEKKSISSKINVDKWR